MQLDLTRPDHLAKVFDRHAPDLLRIARRFSSDQAEDLVQETFLAVAANPQAYDPSRPVGAWLVGILTRRGQALRRQRTSLELPETEAAQAACSLEASELNEAVAAGIAKLPRGEREAVFGRILEGRANQEIAARLGISPGSVRVRLHRGLAKLRALLPAGVSLAALGMMRTPSELVALRRQLVGPRRLPTVTLALLTGGAAMVAVVAWFLTSDDARLATDLDEEVAEASPQELDSNETEGEGERVNMLTGETTHRTEVVATGADEQDSPIPEAEEDMGEDDLVVDIVVRGGAPGAAAGATVTVEPGWFERGAVRPFTEKEFDASEAGTVTFTEENDHMFEPGELHSKVGVRIAAVSKDGAWASRFVELHPPIGAGPHEVWLEPAATLVFEVTLDGEKPLAGASGHISPRNTDHGVTHFGKSDQNGLMRFEHLGPGEWGFYVGALVSEHTSRGRITLQPGEELTHGINFSDGDVAFGVSGVFLDENGEPLLDWVSDPNKRGPKVFVGSHLGEGKQESATIYEARFVHFCAPTDELVLVPSAGPYGDRFEPSRIVVPFGTENVEFRRVAKEPVREMYLRVVDAESGEPLEATCSATRLNNYGLGQWAEKLDGGLHRLKYTSKQDLRWQAYKMGYGSQSGAIVPDEHATPEKALRVALEPGGATTYWILDGVTEEPVLAATITQDNLVWRADRDGKIEVTSKGWVTIAAPGYEPRRWFAGWALSHLHLEPTER